MAIVTLIETIVEIYQTTFNTRGGILKVSTTHVDMTPGGRPRLFAIQANVIQNDGDKCSPEISAVLGKKEKKNRVGRNVGRTTQYCSTPHFMSCKKNRPS